MTDKANFRVGDRVFYAGDEFTSPDYGIVESIDYEKVWAKWDSDGNDLWVYANEITLIDRPDICSNTPDSQNNKNSQDELTVEKCIEFLSSKGFSVTLSQK